MHNICLLLSAILILFIPFQADAQESKTIITKPNWLYLDTLHAKLKNSNKDADFLAAAKDTYFYLDAETYEKEARLEALLEKVRSEYDRINTDDYLLITVDDYAEEWDHENNLWTLSTTEKTEKGRLISVGANSAVDIEILPNPAFSKAPGTEKTFQSYSPVTTTYILKPVSASSRNIPARGRQKATQRNVVQAELVAYRISRRDFKDSLKTITVSGQGLPELDTYQQAPNPLSIPDIKNVPLGISVAEFKPLAESTFGSLRFSEVNGTLRITSGNCNPLEKPNTLATNGEECMGAQFNKDEKLIRLFYKSYTNKDIYEDAKHTLILKYGSLYKNDFSPYVRIANFTDEVYTDHAGMEWSMKGASKATVKLIQTDGGNTILDIDINLNDTYGDYDLKQPTLDLIKREKKKLDL